MMKNLIFILLGLLILETSCHRTTREEQCEEMVKREKRRLPRRITTGVTLDSIVYQKSRQTLVYYHTMSDSIYTDEMIDYGKERLQEDIQREIVNSVALKRLKDEGISFRYVYHGDETPGVRLEMLFKNDEL